MDNHLPVIFTTRLYIYHDGLLYPVRPLRQNINLHQPVEFPLGPAGPQLLEVKKIRRIVVEVLDNKHSQLLLGTVGGSVASRRGKWAVRAGAYHAHWPGHAVVGQHPALLGEAGEILGLGDAPGAAQRHEDLLHQGSAGADGEHHARGHEAQVARADAIPAAAGAGVIIRQAHKGRRVGARGGGDGVGEDQDGDGMERETCSGTERRTLEPSAEEA